MREFTVKVFFNDGSQVSVDCDDFVTVAEHGIYYAIRDDIRIMSFPFSNVKYTVTVSNKNEGCNNEPLD